MVFRCPSLDKIYNDFMPDKKPSSYPFEITLIGKDSPTPRKALVMKITDVGFIQQTDASYLYKVHDNFEAQFVLPGTQKTIGCTVKVVKTYDAMEARINIEKLKVYLVEMHFINISKDFKRLIIEFGNIYNNEKK
jgi:hypothetical protein